MKQADTEPRPHKPPYSGNGIRSKAHSKHRSSGSGVRRRGKSIWTSRESSTNPKFPTKLSKRSFLLDRERPVFFSLAREKKMGGSKKDQPLQMANPAAAAISGRRNENPLTPVGISVIIRAINPEQFRGG
jgi:hypothetical protein